MGSSVFHAAFSSFLSLIPLGFADSYHFMVFFRTWSSITFFGFLNGLIFLPVLLSEVGPLVSHESESTEETTEAESDQVPKELELEKQASSTSSRSMISRNKGRT